MFDDINSIVNSDNQIINETIIFVISIESISIIIDFLFEHVLFNNIIMYDIEIVVFQLIIAMYDYSNI